MYTDFIERLIDIAQESNIDELQYSEGGKRVQFRLKSAVAQAATSNAAPTAAAQAPVAVAKPQADAPAPKGYTVKSSLVGIFYRSPAPDKAPFVSVGDQVTEGQTLGIVEAMKMLNPLEADREGTVVSILVEDGASVDQGTPLFVIEEC
ncbi:acetyl-CoA carboxylase biotin carboxyl carrier protein [Pseudomonas protegens]|uniref:acetyl-CoA carboxylase biotin carboxyl carrier protein n=1 Tax=Pseudomonas protegens TaxID=380021 RepID=UPI001B319486|nr:acetyl-CoA carboxylase biotin carboxyl carrier protein [Pseudomonas protegens]